MSGSAAEVFRAAAPAIPVPSAPVDEIVALAGQQRRRRVRWAAGTLAGVLAAVVAGTWLTTREPAPLRQPEVVPAANPAAVPWYANRSLHLPEVAVELPQIDDLVHVPDGAVFADREGRVALVDQEGRLTQLGRTAPDTPITGSLERGWVAWVEVGGDQPELVVHDTLGRREVGRRPVEAAARPVAIDQDRVYYTVAGESWSWHPPAGGAEPQPGSQLVDVASAVRAWQAPDGLLRITQPLFNIEVRVLGVGAALSDDGELVLTSTDRDLPDEVKVYVAASGEELDSGLDDEDLALAASLGPDHTVTYLVAQRVNAPQGSQFMRLSDSGSHVLRSCDLDTGLCQTLAQLPNSSGTPVLPD